MTSRVDRTRPGKQYNSDEEEIEVVATKSEGKVGNNDQHQHNTRRPSSLAAIQESRKARAQARPRTGVNKLERITTMQVDELQPSGTQQDEAGASELNAEPNEEPAAVEENSSEHMASDSSHDSVSLTGQTSQCSLKTKTGEYRISTTEDQHDSQGSATTGTSPCASPSGVSLKSSGTQQDFDIEPSVSSVSTVNCDDNDDTEAQSLLPQTVTTGEERATETKPIKEKSGVLQVSQSDCQIDIFTTQTFTYLPNTSSDEETKHNCKRYRSRRVKNSTSPTRKSATRRYSDQKYSSRKTSTAQRQRYTSEIINRCIPMEFKSNGFLDLERQQIYIDIKGPPLPPIAYSKLKSASKETSDYSFNVDMCIRFRKEEKKKKRNTLPPLKRSHPLVDRRPTWSSCDPDMVNQRAQYPPFRFASRKPPFY